MDSPTSNTTTPLVSIGLPIYNEEEFLPETLDSLLSQDYENIDIIISDNASTDTTGNICKSYCKKNSRITYLRFEKNMGQGANFKKVRDEAKGDFFMWACGHDKWSKNYISECVATLISHPGAVVAVPTSTWIDQNGEKLEKESGFSDTRGMEVIARYCTLFWGNMHPAYGLMRTRTIRAWPIREIVGEDLIMLTYLALRGDFVVTCKAIWSRREFRFENSYKERLHRYKYGTQQVAKTRFDKRFPLLKLPFYLCSTIVHSNINPYKKVLLMFLLLPSLAVRYVSGKEQYRKG